MNRKRGFTIPELMIAMSFLSMLLIVLLLSTMNIISIYNKGLTLKRVNQSGASIGAAMQKSLRSASGAPDERIATGNDGNNYTVGFCTGQYSYVWSLYPTNGSDPLVATRYNNNSSGPLVGFASVKDNGKSLCGVNPATVPSEVDSTEMLGDGLVMKQPTFHQSSGDGDLISFIYTISTSNNDSDFADPPTGGKQFASANCQGGKAQGDDFCALNTFVITSYAGYNKN